MRRRGGVGVGGGEEGGSGGPFGFVSVCRSVPENDGVDPVSVASEGEAVSVAEVPDLRRCERSERKVSEKASTKRNETRRRARAGREKLTLMVESALPEARTFLS